MIDKITIFFEDYILNSDSKYLPNVDKIREYFYVVSTDLSVIKGHKDLLLFLKTPRIVQLFFLPTNFSRFAFRLYHSPFVWLAGCCCCYLVRNFTVGVF